MPESDSQQPPRILTQPVNLAAWTVIASQIFNLDETVTR